MKKQKTKIAILVVVAIIVIGVVLFLVYRDISAKNKLTEEINSLSETNINMEIKTSGQYGIVEKLVKEDFKSYYDSINTLRENYDEVANIKALNIENYKNDGPEFNTTLETLNTIKTEDQNLIATLNDLIDEAKIEEKAANNGLKGKYVQEYKDILEQIKLADGVNKIKETDAKFDGYLSSLIDVLTYMKDNKDVWFIENDTLKSNSQTFIDEYNKKVDQTNIEL